MRKRYSDEDILKRLRQMAGLGPRKCVICGGVLEAQRKYCSKCRSLHMRELWRTCSRKYQQKRRLSFALSQIDSASSRLGLPKDVRDAAAAIFKRTIEKSIRGRSIEYIVAAALYAACRERTVPLSLDDIAEVMQISKKKISKNYRFIARELLLRLRSVGPVDYIPSICLKLKLSEATQSKAIRLLDEASKKRLTYGRSPAGAAATAVYIACVLTGEKRTQEEVADAAKVTAVTLRNCLREMREGLNLSLPKRTKNRVMAH
jgi:transcription initiation factor TFIIB